eukprot:tig00000940_g5559.t1
MPGSQLAASPGERCELRAVGKRPAPSESLRSGVPRGRPASSSGISLPAGHYWPIACQEPLPLATAPVDATGSLSAVLPCGRPRASSAHCLGAPRTTDSRAPRSAGGVRIACTVEGGRRTAHAQRSATSLRLILLQFHGRAAAPMLAKRPRGSGSSAAPSPLAVLELSGRPVAALAQILQARSPRETAEELRAFLNGPPDPSLATAGAPDRRTCAARRRRVRASGPLFSARRRRRTAPRGFPQRGAGARDLAWRTLWAAALLCASPIPAREDARRSLG